MQQVTLLVTTSSTSTGERREGVRGKLAAYILEATSLAAAVS